MGEYDAELLTESRTMADFFEECVSRLDSGNQHIKRDQISAKTIANWIINKKVDSKTIRPEELIAEIAKATAVEDVAEEVISQAIDETLGASPGAVSDFKAGKEQAFMFLFGSVLRQLSGKGDKKKIQEMLRKGLKG